jgi:hypothetical protein
MKHKESEYTKRKRLHAFDKPKYVSGATSAPEHATCQYDDSVAHLTLTLKWIVTDDRGYLQEYIVSLQAVKSEIVDTPASKVGRSG